MISEDEFSYSGMSRDTAERLLVADEERLERASRELQSAWVRYVVNGPQIPLGFNTPDGSGIRRASGSIFAGNTLALMREESARKLVILEDMQQEYLRGIKAFEKKLAALEAQYAANAKLNYQYQRQAMVKGDDGDGTP